MKKLLLAIPLGWLLALSASPALADEASDVTSTGNWWSNQPWRFNINVYGWLPDAPVTIRVGPTETEIPERLGKIIAGLDMMAMLDFEVHKGPIGVFASPIYYEGKVKEPFQGLFEKRDVTLEEKLWLVDYGMSYALGPWHLGKSDRSPKVTVEPFVGARFLNDDITMDVDPGFVVRERPGKPDRVLLDPKRIERIEARDPESLTTVTSVLDTTIDFNTPIFGLRTRWDLTDRWSLALAGDIGGFQVMDVHSTYQLLGTIAYHFKIWKVSSKAFAGYRYLYIDYEEAEDKGSIELNLRIRGPLIGIGFEF